MSIQSCALQQHGNAQIDAPKEPQSPGAISCRHGNPMLNHVLAKFARWKIRRSQSNQPLQAVRQVHERLFAP